MKKDDLIKNLDDFMKSDIYLNQKKLLEEKQKTVKHGDKVVHINYYEGVITSDDLTHCSSLLKNADLELSSYDKNGVIYNSLEDYKNLMSVVLNDELTKNIILGVVGNIVWDTIKTITKNIFNKVKNNNQSTKREITFGINLSLNKNTGFNFRLNSKISSERVDKSLDQAKEFVRTQQPNKEYQFPIFLYYDDKKNVWIPVDSVEDIKKNKTKDKSANGKKKK